MVSVMTVTRHPMFVKSDPRLGGLPMDRRLAERLRSSYRMLSRPELAGRFLEFLVQKTDCLPALAPEETSRLARRLDQALAGLIEGLDAPAKVRRNLRQFGVELRRHGFEPADRPNLVGIMMAALVDVAGRRWRLDTIREWAEAVTLLFDAALGHGGSHPALEAAHSVCPNEAAGSPNRPDQ